MTRATRLARILALRLAHVPVTRTVDWTLGAVIVAGVLLVELVPGRRR